MFKVIEFSVEILLLQNNNIIEYSFYINLLNLLCIYYLVTVYQIF